MSVVRTTHKGGFTMGSANTMLLIMNAFVSLCEEMPLQKVSISDIVERTGVNRKTFYYHFIDKNYLVEWIFRHDLGEALHRQFPEDVLIYESDKSDSLSHFPYYIRKKSGIRSLDHSEFWDTLARVFESRRKFYTQALLENGPCSLRNYLYELYLPAMHADIEPYFIESLSSKKQYRFPRGILHLRIFVLFHSQMRSSRCETRHCQCRPFRQHYS